MADTAPQAESEGFIAARARIAPVPAWVDYPALEIPPEADPRFVVSGVSVLLEDVQVSQAGAEPVTFWRRVDMVVATAGASAAARFQAEFDPACERLEIHAVRIHRGGQIIERAAAGDFEVLRRERNLEMRHFDGRLTVCLEIPDVRVGDVVETAWSVSGEREILAGKHASWMRFEWSPAGMVETRYRLLAPASREIRSKAVGGTLPEPTETRDGELTDRRWRVREREGVRTEPLALPWLPQLASLQLSEWRDWGEVAARFIPAYQEEAPLPAELEATVAEFAALPTPAARAAALLRFVQSSVRYLAISMGEGGLVPRPIVDIWQTRYGDCKDVTKLYVLMARRLGLEACPTLVNTVGGEANNDLLPTAAAFDHCLIRVRIDGKSHWLDATMPVQLSPLDTLVQPRFGWALALAAETTALEHMGAEPFVTVCEVNEKIDLPDRASAPVSYEWKIVSRGWRAELVRAYIAREGEVGYFRAREEELQSLWPKAKIVAKSIADDVATNVMTVTQRVEILDAWRELAGNDYAFTTADMVIANSLAPLDPGPVKLPLFLGRIGRYVRRVDVNAARAVAGAGWEKIAAHDAASANFLFRKLTPKEYLLEETFQVRRTAMPAESAERYREIAAQLRATDVNFLARTKKDKFDKMKGGGGGVSLSWIWIAIVLLGVLVRILGR